MPLSYASRVQFRDDDHNQAVVVVQTNRCWYNVALRSGEVIVVGPGVEESFSTDDFPDGLSYEGLALMAVIAFEEKER